MSREPAKSEDPVWDAAWDWVTREHRGEGLPESERRALAEWLGEDPRNRAAYQRAAKLWLLSGLVPPVNDVPIPGADGQGTDEPPGEDVQT